MKSKTLNKEKIVDAARCEMDEHGVYCVTSPEFDMVLGCSHIEGRAWQIFFELLDDTWVEYEKGNVHGYQPAKAFAKGGRANTRKATKA